MCNYFSHDDNARNDIKMVKLRKSKDGIAKYGLFWMLIEILSATPGYSLPVDFETIAWDLKTDEKLVRSVVEDFELFEIVDEKFYSLSLNRRMELKEAKSKQARDAANSRWKKADDKPLDSDSNASVMRPHSVSNAIKLNKSKLKEIKDFKDIYVQTEPKNSNSQVQLKGNSSELNSNFAFFWQMYPKKVSKLKAEVCFKKINPSPELFSDMIRGLERYMKSSDVKRGFIQKATTWLNGREWESEYDVQIKKNDLEGFLGGE